MLIFGGVHSTTYIQNDGIHCYACLFARGEINHPVLPSARNLPIYVLVSFDLLAWKKVTCHLP